MARRRVAQEKIDAAEAAISDRAKRIDFYTTEYNVELLVEKLSNDDFVIPDYQRAYTWDDPRKSKFIESVLIGLPIPFLFFWENEDGKMEVVDGSQRLRTLKEYVREGFTLKKLEEIASLNGTRFDDLPESRQRKFLNRSIRGIVLNEHADAQARFDMFERINTGSKVANPAEVRRGALTGLFQTLIEELAQDPVFCELAPVSKKSRNERVPDELVTRFFAYGDGLDEYKDSPNRFIFDYIKKMNERCEQDDKIITHYKARFERMLRFAHNNFDYGFRKTETAKTTPRVRFEAIAIGIDHAITERPDLDGIRLNNVNHWIQSDEFKEVTTSDAANVKSKLERRINFVKDAILAE